MENDTKIVFNEDQQAELDRIIQDRLAQSNRSHAAELAAVRSEALQRLNAVKGVSGTADEYLDAIQKRELADDIQRDSLGRLFGRNSSGAEANKLAKENPALYRQLKQKAEALGLVGKVRVPVSGGKRAFRPNDT